MENIKSTLNKMHLYRERPLCRRWLFPPKHCTGNYLPAAATINRYW